MTGADTVRRPSRPRRRDALRPVRATAATCSDSTRRTPHGRIERPWHLVEPWRLVGPLALSGAAGGALWIYLAEGFLPGLGLDAGFARLLYAWWVPGLLFGLALTATLRLEPHDALALSTLTGLIHMGAVGTTLGLRQLGGPALALPFAWQGVVSGTLAAFVFHRVAASFLGVRPRVTPLAVLGWGALFGGVLVHALLAAETSRLGILLASGGWAASVGHASHRAIIRGEQSQAPDDPGSERVRRALRGPVLQAIGVAITLASLVSLLASLR